MVAPVVCDDPPLHKKIFGVAPLHPKLIEMSPPPPPPPPSTKKRGERKERTKKERTKKKVKTPN